MRVCAPAARVGFQVNGACSGAAQSPERLKAQMEEIAAAVERERAAVAEAERRLRDLQARLDTIAKVRARDDMSKVGAVVSTVCVP